MPFSFSDNALRSLAQITGQYRRY